MSWKGKKPSDLLGEVAQLVAHLDALPYQEGRLLSTIAEEATMLVDYSSDEHSSHHHVYMAEVEGEGNMDPNELLKQISRDEGTADAGHENDAERDARKLRNQKSATRKRNATERQHHVRCDLDAKFAAAGERGFQTPTTNISGVTTI
jgi:hypothetical protein